MRDCVLVWLPGCFGRYAFACVFVWLCLFCVRASLSGLVCVVVWLLG